MDIALLGSMQIRGETDYRSVSSKKLQVILGTLSISVASPVSSEQLTDELWPEKPLANSRNALQAGIVRLRKLLSQCADEPGAEVLETVAGGYQLNGSLVTTDAARFHALARKGTAELSTDPESAVETLQEALRLWRGPALFDVDGPSCRTEAAALEELRLRVREDIIAAKVSLGSHRDVVSELRQLTIKYPEHEGFCEQLMTVLCREGRQSEALRLYFDTRKRLVTELGVEPGRPLYTLYQKIVSREPVAG